MKIRQLFALCILSILISTHANAQDNTTAFGVKFKGFVNYEMIYDSRQMVSARDGDVLLYPANVKLDPNGNDINESTSFNALAITSRLQMAITGPDAFGAKTSGMISGDFFGTANDKIGLFRLRQAFVKLKWDKATLLAGKAWHPLFAVEVFPKVLSFGAAIPFYPLSRAPQLRYTLDGAHFQWLVAISAQQDFSTAGPDGRTPSYQMHSGMPEFNSRLMYKGKKLLMGVGAGYWQVVPMQQTASGYKTDEAVESYLINSFAKLELSKLTIRGGALYGKNLTNLFMLGGFGVTSISTDASQEQEYEGIAASSFWTELETKNKSINVGLFAGYTKNHGASTEIIGDVYGSGTTIDNTYRIAPRVTYTSGKVKLGLEGIYQSTAYGTRDEYAKVINSEPVDGLRIISSIVYFF